MFSSWYTLRSNRVEGAVHRNQYFVVIENQCNLWPKWPTQSNSLHSFRNVEESCLWCSLTAKRYQSFYFIVLRKGVECCVNLDIKSQSSPSFREYSIRKGVFIRFLSSYFVLNYTWHRMRKWVVKIPQNCLGSFRKMCKFTHEIEGFLVRSSQNLSACAWQI